MAVADIQRLKELLQNGSVKSALIVLPQNPDLDQVAAGLSLSMILSKKGVGSTVSCPSSMVVEFNRLVGVQRVREDLGDKNLVISFAEYPADDIERVSYNIENGSFTLSVIPKPGKIGPQQDQVIISHAGSAANTVFVIGANYPNDLGSFAQTKEILEQPNLCLVANKPLSGWPRAIELIDTNVSSISEVIFEIAQELGVEIDQDEATNLFLGLEDGTRNFTDKAVNSQTFSAASQLLQRGAQRKQAQQQGQQQKRRQDLPADYSPQVRDGSNLG